MPTKVKEHWKQKQSETRNYKNGVKIMPHLWEYKWKEVFGKKTVLQEPMKDISSDQKSTTFVME